MKNPDHTFSLEYSLIAESVGFGPPGTQGFIEGLPLNSLPPMAKPMAAGVQDGGG